MSVGQDGILQPIGNGPVSGTESGRVANPPQDAILPHTSIETSVEEVMPGVFSVLVAGRSYQVNVAPQADGFEVWVGLERYFIPLADPRDRALNGQKGGAAGPVEFRAQMPGKIVKLLAAVGAAVTAGQGLIVVEAMKMQNEVKAPKDGTLVRLHVAEGATVAAGDPLLVVE